MAQGTKPRGRRTPLRVNRLQIDFVILADAAQVNSGKLSMLGGGWNIYPSQQYPAALPFAVAIGILVPWQETNRKHRFEFVIRRAEGETLGKGAGDFEIGREAGLPPGMTQRVTLAVGGQLGIPGPGTYEVAVTIPDDQKIITFEALLPARPPSKPS